jgi:hypothetical protein
VEYATNLSNPGFRFGSQIESFLKETLLASFPQERVVIVAKNVIIIYAIFLNLDE